MIKGVFSNPFRPGAGHMPPYLAGRESEAREFAKLLRQTTILENMILTGLRGVGKTVLLEKLKSKAIQNGWFWVGTDLSESTSISEETIATRLLTDLSVVTSSLVVGSEELYRIGFNESEQKKQITLNYQTLTSIYNNTPGLVSDKLKSVLETIWINSRNQSRRGVIIAYDEAQNLSDHSAKNQYPLSLLLDVFQSIQRKNITFMLLLVGLPTLFPKLVEARTYAGRMFRVVFLDRLDERDCRAAVQKPINDNQNVPFTFGEDTVAKIIELSGGYPYFVQFICREVYDVFIQKHVESIEPAIPVEEIIKKLDTDFFAGRWARATERQRELLSVVAELEDCEREFTFQNIKGLSMKMLSKPFSSSHASQLLSSLCKIGLVYKNRHGTYSFAVPLLDRFIKRQKTL